MKKAEKLKKLEKLEKLEKLSKNSFQKLSKAFLSKIFLITLNNLSAFTFTENGHTPKTGESRVRPRRLTSLSAEGGLGGRF